MGRSRQAGRSGGVYRSRCEDEIFVVGMRRERPTAEDRIACEAEHVPTPRDDDIDELREVGVDVPL